MKYTIVRQFSFTNKKFDVINDAKTISTVKAIPSKQYKGQYNVKLSNLLDESMGDCSCIVEPNKNESHYYLIYSINDQTNEKILFGQLLYQINNSDNLYTIIIGQKLYKVRSSDLKNRRLAVIDIIQLNTNGIENLNYPEILFQVIDSFSKLNDKYRVNIHDKEWPLGYLAITILLHLHESQRNNN